MSMTKKPVIVIVGVNGSLGPHTIKALLSPTFISNISLPIHAITRNPSKSKLLIPNATPSNVKFHSADIKNSSSLVSIFTGADVVVNLVGIVGVDHKIIAEAAANAHVPLYIPSDFGTDISTAGPYRNLFSVINSFDQHARTLDMKTVAIRPGLVAETLLRVPLIGGINYPRTGKFEYFGSLDTKLCVTSLPDIGRAVASVIIEEPSDLPDYVRICGAEISLQELRDTYMKVTELQLTDYDQPLEKISILSRDAAHKEDFDGGDFLDGLRGMICEGYLRYDPTENQIVKGGFTTFEQTVRIVFRKRAAKRAYMAESTRDKKVLIK